MTVRFRTLILLLVFSAVVLASMGGSPAVGSTGTETLVALVSEPGEYVGDGQDKFFGAADAAITATLSTNQRLLRADVTTPSEDFTLKFEAPEGERLKTGDYLYAQRAEVGDPTLPGIDVFGDHRGCNETEGRFRVHEVTTDSEGKLTSVWIAFEQHCDGGLQALRGEIRYGMTEAAGAVVVGPQDIWWPDAAVNSAPVTVPVFAWNPGPGAVKISSSSISGADASDDSIVADACSGVTLAAGEQCNVIVRYQPTTARDNRASLTLMEADGVAHVLSLEGSVFSGRTEFSLQSDPDDFVGQGSNYLYDRDNAHFDGSGDYSRVRLLWQGWEGYRWSAIFGAPRGQMLSAGHTYTGATRFGHGGTPALDVGRIGRKCNATSGTFTITDIYVDRWGDLVRFGVKFEQHCEGKAPALRGTLDFQVNELTASKTRNKIRVVGEVSPNEPGKKVVVKLQKKHAHRFVLVKSKTLTLDKSSSYRTRFKRPRARKCRAIAIFSASDKHLASRTTKTFHC